MTFLSRFRNTFHTTVVSRAATVTRAFARAVRSRRATGATRLRSASLRILRDDRGAVTAEYAVIIMAAVAFAGALVAIMRSSEVRGFLLDLVQQALGSAG